MIVPGYLVATGSLQEVEVSAGIGLEHMLDVQPCITGPRLRSGRAPGRFPALQLLVWDFEVQRAGRDVQLDDVTRLNESQRPSESGLGRNMQNNCPEARSSHTTVAN